MSGKSLAEQINFGDKYKKKPKKESKKIKKPQEGMLKYFKDLFKEN